jgi:hypothetical protein
MHGGPSTGPKKANTRMNARTHGIYSKFLTPTEEGFVVEIGTIDAEIRLMKIRLTRILAAEDAAHGEPELDEVTEHDLIGEEGSREDRRSKVRDYNALIERCVARIQVLELARKELLKVEEPSDIDKRPVGRIIVEVVGAKSSPDHDRAPG